jgi:Holliday junction resolvasome RuvABC endonuclease subunit
MHKNPRSTAALNQLQGAVRLIAALKNIACEFIDNNVAKRVFFKGKSWDAEKNKYVAPSKDQMTSAVTAAVCADSILPSDGHQDGYDAIALAMAYYEAPVTPIVLPRRPT